MITDPHFFKNTQPSVVRCSPTNTTNPHKNQENQIKGKLLLILKLDTATLFIYETYTIVTNKNKIVDVEPKTQNQIKPNEQIIKDQLQHYKDSNLNIGSDIEILAYNPNEYTQEEILGHTI